MADWQKGDLALCVHGERYSLSHIAGTMPTAFMIGGVYIVEQVIFGGEGLVIDGKHSWHPTKAFCATCFKKVPPHKADEFDREIIDLMAGKKVPA